MPLIERLEPRQLLSSAYTVTDLGPIGEYPPVASDQRGFVSLRLNNRGQVIGLVQTNTGQGWSSFFYSDGTVRPLRALSPRLRTAQVADINDAGQIVGEYDAGRRTYTYSPPNLGGYSLGGYVKTGLLDAFEYTPPTPGAVGRAARGTFVHVAAGQAMALNNTGLVAGTFTVRDRATHHRGIAMYVYDPSVRHAKPRAVTPPGQGLSPVVMDDSGDVLAHVFEISGGWQTWLYTAATGQVTRLNVPAGSAVMDMNDSGQVVGGSGQIALGSTGNAFIYSAGQTTDIGNLGGGTATAAAINSSGQVVGISAVPSGNTIPIGTYPAYCIDFL